MTTLDAKVIRPTEFPAEFNLTRAPACVAGHKRHAWWYIGAATKRCRDCGVERMELWGGKSPRASAGGMCRVRFAAPKAGAR